MVYYRLYSRIPGVCALVSSASETMTYVEYIGFGTMIIYSSLATRNDERRQARCVLSRASYVMGITDVGVRKGQKEYLFVLYDWHSREHLSMCDSLGVRTAHDNTKIVERYFPGFDLSYLRGTYI